jgi:tetratricopeptide (TPR) repeat protein
VTSRITGAATALLGVISCVSAFGQEGMHVHGPMSLSGMERLGAVSFENSCMGEVKADINRAVALLHSFWLDEAQRTFEKVAAADPDCAITYWGVAITSLHQINGEPSSADLAAATAALARADKAREKSPREAAYIRAMHDFYDGYKPEQYFEHAKSYADAMGALTNAYPSDLEAKVFYALALLAADPPDDVVLVNAKKAVAVLKPLLREHPNHPGIAHYIIHACDNPEMAKEGLDAARQYASIAPASPHALHMPSHIFARLGLWQDDIASNLASKSASERKDGMHIGAQNRLHAMEFLQYAYLQVGRDVEARRIADEARTVKANEVDSAYPDFWETVQTRFPVLFAIETQDWQQAARLQPIPGAGSVSQGWILLGHAVAAAHVRNVQAGNEAARAYDSLMSREATIRPGSRLATLRDEIHAWVKFSQGDPDGALALIRPVAERQRGVGKGEVEIPAGEMLADMLLLEGRAGEALKAYEISLQSDPNRFNALLGAGQAAELAGRSALAAQYYRSLLSNCAGATGAAVQQLAHPRKVVTGTLSAT